MNISELKGNEKIKEALCGMASETFPHAAIIEGEKGSGKHQLAQFIASAIVCKVDNSPCGICTDCKKSNQGLHPDISLLGEEQELRVDNAREVRRDAYIRPNEAKRKVYIIANADKMNVNTQNAMLKILEEPPETVVFLLLCESKESLLPTVLSRCSVFSLLPPLGDNISEDPHMEEFIHTLCVSTDYEILTQCVSLESLKREQFSDFLFLLSKTARDAIVLQTNGINSSKAAQELADHYSSEKISRIYIMAQEALDQIQYNASNAAIIAGLILKSNSLRI
ncbi:MAG: hypothetical protein N2Z65_01980 [Clostridiales bacterium]|nr:hypothetical protein [Clostridiales bacterium]